jgi:hypothetical protein
MREIADLIDKYFEGLTSLQEEQTLRDYFQGETIAEGLKMYQPMFQFFAAERAYSACLAETPPQNGKRKAVRHWSRTWGLAAAASVLLLLSLPFAFKVHTTSPDTSLAYIDGKKYTDLVRIQTEALKALDNLSDEHEAVYSSQIDALDDVIADLTDGLSDAVEPSNP